MRLFEKTIKQPIAGNQSVVYRRVKGIYFKGRALKKEGKYRLAHDAYCKAIEQGDPKGYYGLAMLAEESGLEKAEVDALYQNCFEDIKKAALSGDYHAASIIGIYYAMGLGFLESDSEQAHLWFIIGALGGDEVAQFNLAVHFYLGVVVEKNVTQAIQWLELAKKQHYEPAFDLYNEINFLEFKNG